METKRDRLNGLFQKYGLNPSEDSFKSPQGWTIITRNGIDKIQANAGIDIKYDAIVVERDFVVVKAKASLLTDKEIFIETFGEADRGPKGNCRQNYPVAMAEKRAMSRAVLKLSGFYAIDGVYGQDESDDFKKSALQQITTKAISKANDMILRGEKTAEEMIDILEQNYEVGESIKFSLKQLKSQK